MSAPKFTPGPWYAKRLHTVFSVQSAVKSVACINRQGHAGRDGTAEANAHLIAAAPELYAALEMTRRDFCSVKMSDEQVATYNIGTAAIRKARGDVA